MALRIVMTAAGVVRAQPAAPQPASVIRGDVFFSDSTTRAPGVLIEARNAAGDLAGRALTNARGSFSIGVARAGQYDVRALRIGFRPTIATGTAVAASAVAASAAAEGAARFRIVLGSEQISLATVRVRADDECRVRADSGQMVAQVWEMARTALASAQASENANLVRVTGLSYQSWREMGGGSAQWHEYDVNDGLGSRPFVSVPAEQLAKEGYSRKNDQGGENFLGPDPNALIADDFAGAHCFQIVELPASTRGDIAVAFRPVRDRRGIVDIAGTFLLDKTSGVLRSLDYKYTNVPADLERAGAGGHIEYLRLATGDWLVNRWSIRLPTVLEHNVVNKTVFSGGRMALSQQRDVGTMWMNVGGGEVLAAESDYRELFADSAIAWRGIVRSDGRPAVEATIEVPEPGLFGAADSAGELILTHAGAGVRDALISSRPMRLLGLPPLRRQITLRDNGAVTPEVIDLLGDDQILSVRCGKDALARNRAALFGVASGDDGRPLKSDSLFVRWIRPEEAGSALATAPPQMVRTDTFGRWVVCGLPRGGQVLITPDEEGKSPLQAVSVKIDRNARLVEADVQWSAKP